MAGVYNSDWLLKIRFEDKLMSSARLLNLRLWMCDFWSVEDKARSTLLMKCLH